MAAPKRKRQARTAPVLDELGGRPDGALAIVDRNEKMIHMTPVRVASAVRFFIARLQANEQFGLPERLAVTAAMRGEGVTYFCRSLASVLAYDSDATVALVDFNWTAPVDDPERPPGLADVLERDVPLEQVLVATTNARLTLIPPGAVPVARHAALAMSTDMDDLMDQLSARFDHLILDVPPVLTSSDTISLTQLADAFVLVVRHGVTTDRQVEQALEELRGRESLGVVLNRYQSRVPKRLRRLVET